MTAAMLKSPMSNITRIESLLDDPSTDVSLDDLKIELNELAKLRNNSRLAFCKRLAIAYMLLIGHARGPNSPRDGSAAKFQKWCDANLRSANGKRYSSSTLSTYLTVGFAANPQKYLEDRVKVCRDYGYIRRRKDERDRKIGLRLVAAATVVEPLRPISVVQLRKKYELTSDVATEVNWLMTAWEQASAPARKQFIALVGK